MKLFNLKFLKEEWQKEIIILRENPFKLAISFSTGIFIGFTPTVGFQTILCFLISRIFKMSFIATFVGSSVPTGIPWLIPFLYYGCYRVGRIFVPFSQELTLHHFKGIKNFISTNIVSFGKPLIVGTLICGIIASVISFFIVYFLTIKLKNENR